nr:LCP family protein [Enterococcus crotali]
MSYGWVNFSYVALQRVYLNRTFPTLDSKKRFIQKTILGSLTLLLLIVAGASVYGATVFNNVQKTADKMYQPLNRKSKSVELDKSEPVSFLLLGIANDSKRKTDFRANTIMVVTVNNQLKKTTITSIPRDAYVEIIGKNGVYDKINHAHSFGGDEMMIETVEHYLDIPINHYFVINMDGLAALSDAVGGVTVNNDFEFDAEGIHYPKGEQHLGGWETLQYARMRYEDPLGDYGRQKRQREVTIQLTKELTSVKSVLRYQQLLDVIGENGQTDMTLDQMMLLMKNYQKALEDIESYQMQGEGFTGDGYTGEEGISYQSISDEEQQKVMTELKHQLAIP